MSTQDAIERKVIERFAPVRLRIDNDSKRHAGPATDSHYRLIIVSNAFEGQRSLQRQRAVFACLADELAGPVELSDRPALSHSRQLLFPRARCGIFLPGSTST